jgi:hypothetical protein
MNNTASNKVLLEASFENILLSNNHCALLAPLLVLYQQQGF